MNNDIFISKTLSWILRHGARQESLPISSDGYIEIKVILNCKQLKGKCTTEDICRIVENNNKRRFTLRTNRNGNLEIKANQGHSIEVCTHIYIPTHLSIGKESLFISYIHM